MSTILTPTSAFPGLLTPAANPQPTEVEPVEALDVDAEAPEADADAPPAEATADANVAPDAVEAARDTSETVSQDVAAAMDTLAQNAATDLVAIFKAEVAAFMPELIAQIVAAVKPKRGRPPGSKNRPKLEAAAPARKGGRKPKAGGRKAKRKAR